MTDESRQDEKAPVEHKTLAAALVAAQREARGGPPADGIYEGKGKQSGVSVGYNYPKPETSIPWMKGVLNRHGLALCPGGGIGDPPRGAPVLVPGTESVMVPIEYAIEHESGERRSWTIWAPVSMPYGGTLMKGWKNTQTGVLKYQLMDALNCRTEADDDEGAVPTAAGRKAEEGPPPPIIGAPPPAAAPPPVPQAAPPRPPQPAATSAPAPLPAPGAVSGTKAAPSTAPPPEQPLGAKYPTPEAARARIAELNGTATPAAAPSAPATPPPPVVAAPATSAPSSEKSSSFEEFLGIEEGNREKRLARLKAAGKATGMPVAAITQYVLAEVLAGEDVDLSDPAPGHADKMIAALEALVRNPLPEAAIAKLALDRAHLLEEEEMAARDQAGAPSAAEEAPPPPSLAPAPPVITKADEAHMKAAFAGGKVTESGVTAKTVPFAHAPPPVPSSAPSAATDVRLSGRFATFMKRASEHRKATGVASADEAYLQRINTWARIPGFTSFTRPFQETERDATAPVLDLLEAGLAAWIAERAPVGAGK